MTPITQNISRDDAKTCTKCQEVKSLSEFHQQRGGRSGLQAHCKECDRKRSATWRAANPDKAKAASTRWYEANKDAMRNRDLKRMYGITLEQYQQMLESQGGFCKICGRHQGDFAEALSVDHCHATGKVRGLLCGSCNRAIGLLGDDQFIAEQAAQYLRTAG